MTVEIKQGDALSVLRGMESGSVQCAITSPPYFGLRDYGIEGQLGAEKTPEEYVCHLVEVMREVKRVLREDGVLWLNLGDSYSTSPAGNKTWGNGVGANKHYQGEHIHQIEKRNLGGGIKNKDLIGIPWMIAFALRADGWHLRSDIIWSKPNPMPESVTDRPTKAHEYVFLLSKSATYYYDIEAIKEPSVYPNDNRKARSSIEDKRMPTEKIAGVRPGSATYPTRNRRTVWTINTAPYKGAHFATFPPKLVEPMVLAGCPVGGIVLDPFAGSGTVGAVCVQHNRSFIGIELNPAYITLAQERITKARMRDPRWMRDTGATLPEIARELRLSVPEVARMLRG